MSPPAAAPNGCHSHPCPAEMTGAERAAIRHKWLSCGTSLRAAAAAGPGSRILIYRTALSRGVRRACRSDGLTGLLACQYSDVKPGWELVTSTQTGSHAVSQRSGPSGPVDCSSCHATAVGSVGVPRETRVPRGPNLPRHRHSWRRRVSHSGVPVTTSPPRKMHANL